MAAGRALKDPCPERKVVQQEFLHVTNPYQLEATLGRSENVVTYLPEDGSLPDLGPIHQVLEPKALAEVADQVYETVLRKEVRHSLAPQDPRLFKVHVHVPKYDGFLETFQGLLQVRQVIEH